MVIMMSRLPQMQKSLPFVDVRASFLSGPGRTYIAKTGHLSFRPSHDPFLKGKMPLDPIKAGSFPDTTETLPGYLSASDPDPSRILVESFPDPTKMLPGS